MEENKNLKMNNMNNNEKTRNNITKDSFFTMDNIDSLEYKDEDKQSEEVPFNADENNTSPYKSLDLSKLKLKK